MAMHATQKHIINYKNATKSTCPASKKGTQNRRKSLHNNEKQLLPLKMRDQTHFPPISLNDTPLQYLIFGKVYV